MKVWNITQLAPPKEALTLEEKQLPSPGPGELRIKVDAAALGLPDAMMCRGDYEFKPELPFTAGQEVCGAVLETGDHVSASVGDKVMGVTSFFMGHGGFAEECMSMEGMVYPTPDNMSDVEAAAFGIPYQTAWIGLVQRGGIKPGDNLVVLGATGGCGSAAVQLGHALGARVIAVAGGADKTSACRDFGADDVIDHRTQDFVTEVNQLTDGQGAQLIFDPVGGESFERAVGCLASGGRLLAVGFASGRWGQANTHDLVLRNGAVLGVFAGACSADERLKIHNKLVALYQEEKITPLIHAVVDFEELPNALNQLESCDVKGKLVTCPSGKVGFKR